MHDWMWGWGPWPMLIPLLFLILLLVGVLGFVRYLGSDRRRSETSRASDLLDERYARGEIDREEYLQRRRDLEDR